MERLLVMDDDRSLAAAIRDAAEGLGFDVRIAAAFQEFDEAYGAFAPQVIALDLMMPDCDGFELLRHLTAIECKARIILLSGAADMYLRMAQEVGGQAGLNIAGVLPKPFRLSELHRMLRATHAA